MNKRSNDKIPKDEMLLAESLAAVNARGLKACCGLSARDPVTNKLMAVCAVGAVLVSRGWRGSERAAPYEKAAKILKPYDLSYEAVYVGNDRSDHLFGEVSRTWAADVSDRGEDFGHAYRQAMA